MKPSVPVVLKHDKPLVPNGFQTPITTEVLSSDDIVLSNVTISVVAQAEEAKPFFQIMTPWGMVY